MKNNILREAETVIYGDREKTYGNPAKNLSAIAAMWAAYIKSRGGSMDVTVDDVAIMMVLVKAARLANQPGHHDSLVDICGYAALVERVHESDNKEAQ